MTQRRRLQTQREKSRDLGMLDVPYLILTLLLVAVGLIMLFSASYARAYYLTGNSARYFTSQLVFAALGTVVMLLVSRVPYRWYEKCNWLILAAAKVLLVLVLVIGTNSNGATRWINLGFTSLQPSEIAKFSLVVYLAAMLDKYQANARSVPVFLICVLPLAVFAVLLKLEPHFSAIIILCMLTGVLLFVGGANRKCLIVVAVLAAAALAALLLSGGYTSDRIMAWRDPEHYASDEGNRNMRSARAACSGWASARGGRNISTCRRSTTTIFSRWSARSWDSSEQWRSCCCSRCSSSGASGSPSTRATVFLCCSASV